MKNASELAHDVRLTAAEKGHQVASHTAEQRRINDYWSRWARDYEAHQAARRETEGGTSVWEDVWNAALPQPPAQVLDLGTGSGAVAFLLAGMGHQVTGIDLAEGMLAEARRRSGYSSNPMFGRGDASTPEFDDETFDALTARYVLWTLRGPEQALAEWLRILRPGGVLVAVDSLWFPQGLACQGEASSERARDFRETYRGHEQDLPLAEADSIDAFAGRIRAAGFVDVTVDELPAVMEADRAHGVAPGHDVQMQHRIRAKKPEAASSSLTL